MAAWGAARLAGADRCRRIEAPTAPLLSFTPHVAAAALLGSLLPRRGRGPAAIAALAGTALAAVVLPRTIGRPQPPAGGATIGLVTVNLLGGRACEEAIVSLVQRSGADVLFLQELTDAAAGRLKQAGLADLLPHEVTDLRGESTRGSGIYARFPLTQCLALRPTFAAQPTARLHLPDGQQMDLVCVHVAPPTPPWSRAKTARWRQELDALPAPVDSPASPPRVLAGDFNASLDHAHFRRILHHGYVDAACQVGRGLVPTWGPLRSPAVLTVDHVLADPRCAVLSVSLRPLPGSDHRAVCARLRLPTIGGPAGCR